VNLRPHAYQAVRCKARIPVSSRISRRFPTICTESKVVNPRDSRCEVAPEVAPRSATDAPASCRALRGRSHLLLFGCLPLLVWPPVVFVADGSNRLDRPNRLNRLNRLHRPDGLDAWDLRNLPDPGPLLSQMPGHGSPKEQSSWTLHIESVTLLGRRGGGHLQQDLADVFGELRGDRSLAGEVRAVPIHLPSCRREVRPDASR